MNEQQMWAKVRDALKPYLIMERLTDKLMEGVPDVVYGSRAAVTHDYGLMGWLELKVVKAPGGLLHEVNFKIPWKSPAQPLFLNRWAREGHRAGCLMVVDVLGAQYWTYWCARGGHEWLRWIQERRKLDDATDVTRKLTGEWLWQVLEAR